MRQTDRGEIQDEDGAAFRRGVKYALVAYAVVELIVIAVFVFHRVAR